MQRQHYRAFPHPIAFAGVSNLKRFYPTVPVREIREWLTKEDQYTRKRELKKPRYNFTFSDEPRHRMQIDLIDLRPLRSRNRNVSYYFLCIDSFSRRVWLQGMKRKTAAETREAFENILNRMSRSDQIKHCTMDDGTEYKGVFLQFLQERGIEKHIARKHATIAERAIRSIKSLMGSHAAFRETLQHVGIMQDIAETYNNRYHRGIGTSPNEADRVENIEAVRYYVALQRREKIHSQFQKKPEFRIGDLVRVAAVPATWQRSYHPTFTREIFRVVEVIQTLPEPMFRVQALGNRGRILKNRWYGAELQKVDIDSLKVSKVLWRKRRNNPHSGAAEVLVEWAGLPPELATYVDVNELRNLSRTGPEWR